MALKRGQLPALKKLAEEDGTTEEICLLAEVLLSMLKQVDGQEKKLRELTDLVQRLQSRIR